MFKIVGLDLPKDRGPRIDLLLLNFCFSPLIFVFDVDLELTFGVIISVKMVAPKFTLQVIELCIYIHLHGHTTCLRAQGGHASIGTLVGHLIFTWGPRSWGERNSLLLNHICGGHSEWRTCLPPLDMKNGLFKVTIF